MDRYNAPGVSHLKVTMTGFVVNQKEWCTDIKVMTSLADQIEITSVTDQIDITSVTGKANMTNSETNMRDITNILDIYEYILLLH